MNYSPIVFAIIQLGIVLMYLAIKQDVIAKYGEQKTFALYLLILWGNLALYLFLSP